MNKQSGYSVTHATPEQVQEAKDWIRLLNDEGFDMKQIGLMLGYTEVSAGPMISRIIHGIRPITVTRYERLKEVIEARTNPNPEPEMPATLTQPATRAEATRDDFAPPAPVERNGRPRSTLEDLKMAQETLRSLARRLTQTQAHAVALMRPGLGQVVSRLEAMAADLEV